jgi:uncharacterized protein YabN with tetrapyrrole methylase and pyrophosphatase domain
VLRSWNRIKREDERGGEIFGRLPETLPSTLYAQKVLKRAESAGFDWRAGDDPGDRLLAAVREAIDAGVDPELALRGAADRFRLEVEQAEGSQ